MMYGHEKSDPVVVAVKPANKAKEAHCGDICRGGRSGVGGAKGGGQGEYALAKHVLGSEPGSRVTGAGLHTARNCRHTPEVGAVCGKAACTDLCGGREVTRVPTANCALLRCVMCPRSRRVLEGKRTYRRPSNQSVITSPHCIGMTPTERVIWQSDGENS